MVLGSFSIQGSATTTASCHTCFAISKPPCSSSSASFPIPKGEFRFLEQSFAALRKASPKYVPLVASNTIERHDLTFAGLHDTLVKHNALVKQQGLVNSCQRSLFSEHWIEDCICEVVRHIHEAPFLLTLSNHQDTPAITVMHRQRVPTGDALSADKKWRAMKHHLSEASPDAVILVHDLCDSYFEGSIVRENLAKQSIRDASGKEGGSNGTRLWGILLLGKTIAESACYILETTSVASSFGICTHYCLSKAQSFGPSWSDQMQSSWLLKTER